MPYPKTLFGKLALAQAVFGVLVALGFFLILDHIHNRYHVEIIHAQGHGLAQWLLRERRELAEQARGDTELLQVSLMRLQGFNPAADLYWLDRDGRIVAASASARFLQADRVRLAPLKSMLRAKDPMPAFADDPRDPSQPKVFSVAAAGDPASPDGYLFITLREPDSDYLARAGFAHTFWLAGGLFAAVLALALGTALVAMTLVLKPFRRLSQAMDRFQGSGFSEWSASSAVATNPSGGELERLIAHFNEMAAQIAGLLVRFKDDDRRMREIFAEVSHDLRTPLTVLQGNLESLQLKGDRLPPTERQRLIQIAGAQATSLGKLVDSVFQLSQLESPQYRPKLEIFSLAEIVQDVAQKFALKAGAQGVSVATKGAEGHGLVSADIALIERVLDNLIDNALKHAKRADRIEISMQQREEQIEVALSDNGEGLPVSAQRALEGNLLVRANARKGEGRSPGLGLAIVSRILQLHGSRLGWESIPERGTTFRFALPRAVSPSVGSHPER
ncbi:MAG: HAMP domain-containing histidine kinase [Betaproteobacteria bacterium]|nr:HAMP domain-containing histidine kinase [Betaproteobacteria bacterium]